MDMTDQDILHLFNKFADGVEKGIEEGFRRYAETLKAPQEATDVLTNTTTESQGEPLNAISSTGSPTEPAPQMDAAVLSKSIQDSITTTLVNQPAGI